MTPEAALTELLGRVGARFGESVTVSTQELNQWPAAAVSALKAQGLLLKARPAKSVVCPGCEQACSMAVHTVTHPQTATATSFVVCDKRSDTHRVAIAAAQLALWSIAFDCNRSQSTPAQETRQSRPLTLPERTPPCRHAPTKVASA